MLLVDNFRIVLLVGLICATGIVPARGQDEAAAPDPAAAPADGAASPADGAAAPGGAASPAAGGAKPKMCLTFNGTEQMECTAEQNVCLIAKNADDKPTSMGCGVEEKHCMHDPKVTLSADDKAGGKIDCGIDDKDKNKYCCCFTDGCNDPKKLCEVNEWKDMASCKKGDGDSPSGPPANDMTTAPSEGSGVTTFTSSIGTMIFLVAAGASLRRDA